MNIEKYLIGHDICQKKVIPVAEIPFREEVVAACATNQCGQYGTCWTCPPGVGTFEEPKARALAFENALVFTCKYALEDCFDYDGMYAAGRLARKTLFSIADAMRADGLRFQAMGCGSCDLCEKCTYPDAPCRFPDRALTSVEANGIQVIELAKNIGINYNNGENTVTYFSMILF